MRIRKYSGPLTVMAMGTLGFSLFCIVSAVALTGADKAHPVSIAPKNIVDSAFSNLNTMAALTAAAVSQYVSTPTRTPTPSSLPALNNSSTPTLTLIPTRTPIHVTKTRGAGLPPAATSTGTHIPATPTVPSKTAVPPTNTPIPTDTSIPPDTNTPELPPTAEPPTATEPPTQPPTEPPAPTATNAPAANATDAP